MRPSWCPFHGVLGRAMHLLCKVHCRMQCKAATFAMQRERKRVREREGARRSPSRPCSHGLHLIPQLCGIRLDIAARPARAAQCHLQFANQTQDHRSARTGCTRWSCRTSEFPKLPLPAWAAPFPTSAPGLEQHGPGAAWLRSEPTARLCLVPCPDATIAHAPFSAALARRLAHPRVGSTLTVLATRATRAPAHRSWALGESDRPSLFARVRGAAWRR